MNLEQALDKLQNAKDREYPVDLHASILSQLSRNDVPKGMSIQVGVVKDGCLQLDWNGTIYNDGRPIVGEAEVQILDGGKSGWWNIIGSANAS